MNNHWTKWVVYVVTSIKAALFYEKVQPYPDLWVYEQTCMHAHSLFFLLCSWSDIFSFSVAHKIISIIIPYNNTTQTSQTDSLSHTHKEAMVLVCAGKKKYSRFCYPTKSSVYIFQVIQVIKTCKYFQKCWSEAQFCNRFHERTTKIAIPNQHITISAAYVVPEVQQAFNFTYCSFNTTLPKAVYQKPQSLSMHVNLLLNE